MVDPVRAGEDARQRDPRGAAAHRQGPDRRRLRQRPQAVQRRVPPILLGPGDGPVQAHPHAERHVLRRPRLPAGRQAADRRRHEALREAAGERHLRGGRDDGQERVARRSADHAPEGDRVPCARRASLPQHEGRRRQAAVKTIAANGATSVKASATDVWVEAAEKARSRRSTGPPGSRSAARIATATTCTGSPPRSRGPSRATTSRTCSTPSPRSTSAWTT